MGASDSAYGSENDLLPANTPSQSLVRGRSEPGGREGKREEVGGVGDFVLDVARNLKVGFDVDQLGIAAAETVGFSLQKVYSSFSSFFVNRDNSCSGGLPNYLHQHNLRDLIPR